MLPVYARALDLPADYFTPFFHQGGEITVRMIHYPPATADQVDEGVFGTAAHTDRNLFTILAQGDTPGLQIMLPDGEWMRAPLMPGAFVVNSGDTLRRWSNERFLSTPHRVLNNIAGRDRYSVPFFVGPEYDTVLECLPSCRGADNPPKYEPVTMEAFSIEFLNRNYANRNQQDSWSEAKTAAAAE
jgi:isopenicillin N synthase-like dioxygenase